MAHPNFKGTTGGAEWEGWSEAPGPTGEEQCLVDKGFGRWICNGRNQCQRRAEESVIAPRTDSHERSAGKGKKRDVYTDKAACRVSLFRICLKSFKILE